MPFHIIIFHSISCRTNLYQYKSRHVITYHTISCHLACHTVSVRIIANHAMSFYAILFRIIVIVSYHTESFAYHYKSCHIIPYQTISYHISCHMMPYQYILAMYPVLSISQRINTNHVMLFHIIPFFLKSILISGHINIHHTMLFHMIPYHTL